MTADELEKARKLLWDILSETGPGNAFSFEELGQEHNPSQRDIFNRMKGANDKARELQKILGT